VKGNGAMSFHVKRQLELELIDIDRPRPTW